MTVVDQPVTPLFQTLKKLHRAEQRVMELEAAMEVIARKPIMDSVAAISMRAIARAHLPQRRKQPWVRTSGSG